MVAGIVLAASDVGKELWALGIVAGAGVILTSPGVWGRMQRRAQHRKLGFDVSGTGGALPPLGGESVQQLKNSGPPVNAASVPCPTCQAPPGDNHEPSCAAL